MDRLAGLESVITAERIRQALAQTGRVNERACRLTQEVMLWVVMAMGLFTELPIRQVFKACRRGRAGEATPSRSSLCAARQRLGVEPVQQLHADIVRPLATVDTPGAFYRGLRWMGRCWMCPIDRPWRRRSVDRLAVAARGPFRRFAR